MDKNFLKDVKKIYFIGIGGIGMSGLAEYLFKKGYEVSGSDASMTDITVRLEKMGIKINDVQTEKNITEEIDLVVYTSAVKEDNEEFRKAISLNIPLCKRAEMLGSIVNDKFLISISGTHGKTTTTAMTSKVLIDNNFDPTVFGGGNLDVFDGGSSRAGDSDIAVVEADEYDRSFHQLNSDAAVIMNIEEDHLDIYENIEGVRKGFEDFLKNSNKELSIIANGDDENVNEVVKSFKNVSTFGFSDKNNFKISGVTVSQTSMSFFINDERIEMKVLGEHNAMNATAAYIASRKTGVSTEGFKQSIKDFSGVKRRLEIKYDDDITIFDDYAHHPTEAEKTLKTLNQIKKNKLITVFQPHLYSRTRDFYKEFAEAFAITDVLLLEKIYPAREKAIEGVTSELILNEINSGKAFYFENEKDVFKKLDQIIEKNDIIVFMGAGTVTDHCRNYIKRIKDKAYEI